MRPVVLFAPIVLFVCVLAVHVIWWRLRRPRNQLLGILMQWIVGPMVVFVLVALVPSPWSRRLALTPMEALSCLILFLSLAGVYVCSWPAAQTFSPTLAILRQFRGTDPPGRTAAYFQAHLKNAPQIQARIQDLKDSEWIQPQGDHVVLTRTSKAVAWFFVVYRRFLRLPDCGI